MAPRWVTPTDIHSDSTTDSSTERLMGYQMGLYSAPQRVVQKVQKKAGHSAPP